MKIDENKAVELGLIPITVYVDGVEIKRCVEFDIEKGYAIEDNFDGSVPVTHQGVITTDKDDLVIAKITIDSGKKFDGNKPRFSLVPQKALESTIDVLEFGAKKYGAHNWKMVDEAKQRYSDAAMRHLLAYFSGETIDTESGLPHLSHAQCCLMFLNEIEHGVK